MLLEKILYWFSRPLVGTYTGSVLRMDVRRHCQFPQGAKIIAANHPSTTDPFYIAAMLRQQAFILIDDVLFQVPVFSTYLRNSGHIPVQCGQGQAAVNSALLRLRQGKTIMIFPEGALSPAEGGFHPAHTGVARLALLSGAPVIPVGIHLNCERLHKVATSVRGKVVPSRWYLRGPYHVTAGKPLHFNGNVEDRPRVRAIADSVMYHIIELAHESENRVAPTAGTLQGALTRSLGFNGPTQAGRSLPKQLLPE